MKYIFGEHLKLDLIRSRLLQTVLKCSENVIISGCKLLRMDDFSRTNQSCSKIFFCAILCCMELWIVMHENKSLRLIHCSLALPYKIKIQIFIWTKYLQTTKNVILLSFFIFLQWRRKHYFASSPLRHAARSTLFRESRPLIETPSRPTPKNAMERGSISTEIPTAAEIKNKSVQKRRIFIYILISASHPTDPDSIADLIKLPFENLLAQVANDFLNLKGKMVIPSDGFPSPQKLNDISLLQTEC